MVPKSKETDEFDAPDINFLGHSFRFVLFLLSLEIYNYID